MYKSRCQSEAKDEEEPLSNSQCLALFYFYDILEEAKDDYKGWGEESAMLEHVLTC